LRTHSFVDALKSILHKAVPFKTVRLKAKDPYFVTPLIKSLLAKRCRLRKYGHTEQADVLAVRINHLISVERSKHLTRLAEASPKNFGLLLERVLERTGLLLSVTSWLIQI